MAKRKYPDTLWIKYEPSVDGGEPYFLAFAEPIDAAEIGAVVEVAVYRYERVALITTRLDVK